MIETKIIEIINIIPGIRYKELQRLLNVPNGTLSYYIDSLEKRGKIKVKRDMSSTRLFPLTIDEYKANLISILRNRVRYKIVKYLLDKGSASFYELQRVIDKSYSTLAWHLDKLINAEVITVNNDKGINEYRLKDKEVIEKIVESEDVVNTYLDIWGEL